MTASPCVQCRIDPYLKLRLRAVAQQRGLTESGLLQRLVVAAVGLPPVSTNSILTTERVGPLTRLSVRLRPGDHAQLRERAAGRGLARSTYVSMLVRTHLRNVPPLPDRELTELRNAVGALGIVGRNLNRIARIANRTGRLEGITTRDLQSMLDAFEKLRIQFKSLIEANIASWETGHAQTSR